MTKIALIGSFLTVYRIHMNVGLNLVKAGGGRELAALRLKAVRVEGPVAIQDLVRNMVKF